MWDIFRHGYRVFGAEQVDIRKQWDVSTPEGVESFKDYFYESIINMSEQEKMDWMGYLGQQKIIQNPKISPETKRGIVKGLSDKVTQFIDRMKRFFSR